MNSKQILLPLFLITVASCQTQRISTSDADVSVMPTQHQTPTLVVSTTNPHPFVIARQVSPLYAGPSNISFIEVAEINAGESLTPLGLYGDFVHVVGSGEKDGYIWKEHLEYIPLDLPIMGSNEVPAEVINLFDFIFEPGATFKAGRLSIQTVDDEWFPLDIGPLQIATPFTLNTQFSAKGVGAIVLSGSAPSFGEWWSAPRLLVFSDHLELRDGRNEHDYVQIDLPGLENKLINIVFADPKGYSFTVYDQTGNSLITVDVSEFISINLDEGLFPSGNLFFGVLVGPLSRLTVSDLNLAKPPSGERVDERESSPRLRELADEREFLIGSSGAAYRLEDLQYQEILAGEYNCLKVPFFEMGDLRPSQDVYDFRHTDALVSFAERHNMSIIGSPVVHGGSEFLPDWLKNGNFSRDELINILHDHISTVVGRYKGRIHMWELVNEYGWMSYYQHWDLDFWKNHIGPEYVEMAFAWAKQADPGAFLLLDEPELEDRSHPMRSAMITSTYNLTTRLLEKGVPIDGIAIQGHLLLNSSAPTAVGFAETLELFEELGLDVYITEFDVNLANIPGSQEERKEYQAELYRIMLQTCLQSEVCKGFVTFEFSDRFTWLGDCDGCLGIPDPQPLPFDSDYQPKPAYFAMYEVLANHSSETVPEDEISR